MIFLSMSTLETSIPAEAAIKVGSSCKSLGDIKVKGGMELVCAKKRNTYKWKVNKRETQISETDYEFLNRCDKDPYVMGYLKKFQDNLDKNRYLCPPPYRFLVKTLPQITPQFPTDFESGLIETDKCKLTRSEGFQYAFDRKLTLHPDIKIQIVPFSTDQFPESSTPESDWGEYFEYLRSSLTRMTDVPSNYQFRIAPKYFRVALDLKSLNLNGSISHGDNAATNDRYKLINEVIKVSDPELNFSDIDYIFFVANKEVSRDILANQIAYGKTIVTSEKSFSVNSYITSSVEDFNSKYWIPREPFSFIHEMMHIFNTAEDSYGNVEHGGDELGTGSWGNMSGAMMDHLAWHKWNARMISDSQIMCASTKAKSTYWIRPSTYSGQIPKLLMFPLSNYEAIAIESIRSAGFNYKLPKSYLGALIYRINTREIDDFSEFGDGMIVLCPTNRPCSSSLEKSLPFKLSKAALKPGDFLEIEKMKIELIDADSFGDIVKISPIE